MPPPAVSRAPSASPMSIRRRTFSRCTELISGPSCVLGEAGSPILIAEALALSAATKAS